MFKVIIEIQANPLLIEEEFHIETLKQIEILKNFELEGKFKIKRIDLINVSKTYADILEKIAEIKELI